MFSEQRKKNIQILAETLEKIPLEPEEMMLAFVDFMYGSTITQIYSARQLDKEALVKMDTKFLTAFNSITKYLEKTTDSFIEDVGILLMIVQNIMERNFTKSEIG